MTNQFRFAATLAVATVSMALLLGGCKQDTQVNDPARLLPQRLDSRVEMRPGERLRVTTYGTDSDIKLSAIAEFSGDQAKTPDPTVNPDTLFQKEIFYRTDGAAKGSISRARVLYPVVEGEKTRRVARELDLADDGKTHVKDRQFWLDGKAKFVGDLLSSQRFEGRQFAQDGTTLLDLQQYSILSATWKLTREELYRAQDGSLSKLTVRADDGTLTSDEYSPQHVVTAHSVMNASETNFVAEYYLDDGKTLTKKLVQDYQTEINYYDHGQVVRQLTFLYDYQSMVETTFSGPDKPLLKRTWTTKKDTADTKAGKVQMSDYILTHVEQFDAEGKSAKDFNLKDGQVTQYTDHAAGKTKNGDAFNSTVYNYRADGTLEKIMYVTPGSLPNINEQHSADEKVLAPTLDPAVLVDPAFEVPPKAVKHISYPYGGYGYGYP